LPEGSPAYRRERRGGARAAAALLGELKPVVAAAAIGLGLAGLVGCDQGHPDDQATAGPPVHVVGTNTAGGIPTNGYIEIAFDRLLNPSTITRQTFQLSDKRGNFVSPNVTYDPVARVVTLLPPQPFLQDQQYYQVNIVTPKSATDTNGLRAIDGATLDPTTSSMITFIASSSLPAQSQPPAVDFCKDIFRLFDKCAGTVCHTAPTVAAQGLLLDSPGDIAMTAVGRVAQESNTGPRAVTQPAERLLAIDMPILDPGPGGTPTNGDPANSFMLYKLLMAVPLVTSTTQQPPYCDGGMPAPPAMGPFHSVMWQPLSDDERGRLSNLVPGREMPFPGDPSAPLNMPTNTLTLNELELVSAWIAQVRDGGAPLVPATCGSCVP
jgi:hypothetical protein